MDMLGRIDRALDDVVRRAGRSPAPPKLSAAMHHAVVPGGARVRPQLCLAVAAACGDDRPDLSLASGVAIELMHCASLVHDDLPCFDDADVRRGSATVHAVYGAPLAVLAGDALIVLAFEAVGRAAGDAPARLPGLVGALAGATGLPGGIAAGQGWESEEEIALGPYHRAKTGALFVAATRMGALAAGCDPTPWTALGAALGEAYQIADDLRDALLTAEELGKPAGQDDAHARPNAVATHGVDGAMRRLSMKLDEATEAVPECAGAEALRQLVRLQGKRLTPSSLAPASVA